MGSRCGRRQTVQPASFVAQNSYSLKMKRGSAIAKKNPAAEGGASGAGRLHDSNVAQCGRAQQMSSSQTYREHLAIVMWLDMAGITLRD
jgi:hypothetical protein